MRTYRNPAGQALNAYLDALTQKHLLIAGTTGSGKSVLLNGLIYTALYSFPNEKQFILIDPKRVELSQYRLLQHTICYASEPQQMIAALQKAMDITEKRFQKMQRQGTRKSTESHIYVIIDELADLMTTNKKQVTPLLQRLCQIGRAANMHVIACTQHVLSSDGTLPTAIKVNFDARFALRTRSKQDSRNILDMSGCETLPEYGYAYYMSPGKLELIKIPYYTDAEIDERVKHWTNQRCLLARLIAS